MFNFVDHQERRKRDQERLALEEASKASAAQAAQTEQLTPVQEQQIQKATELLENLSSASSQSLNPSSADGSANSPLVEPLKGSSLVTDATSSVPLSKTINS